METKQTMVYELPEVKYVLVEVESGFAVSGGPEQYTIAGSEVF